MGRSHSLPDRLLERARVQPEAVALVLDGERVSYAALHAMATGAAARLRALDLPPGASVAVRAVKSPETIAVIAACLLTRRPVLLASAELGEHALEALLARAGCAALLDGPATTRLTAGPPVGEDVSFMLTTSGSTGVPKIVPLDAGAVDRFTDWAGGRFGIGPGTAVLNYAPLTFDLCLLDVWATLKAGGTVVLVDQERASDGRHLAALVESEGVEVVQGVPLLYRLIADASDSPLPGVRHVIVTGDKLSPRLLGRLPELFPGARLYNVYGCTETNDSFLYEITGTEESVPIGRPLPGVEALVVDETGAVLDGPATGELLVRTPFQTRGYVGGDAFPDGRFRSGDVVSRDEHGVFTLVGRNDFQVKVRGTRVNLQEVEHLLLAHEAAADAAVVGVPDELAGVRIHAVVRRTAPGALNSLALRDYCRTRLPRAAIPSTIQVVDDPLPSTPTGKPDRRSIIENLRNGS